MRTLRTPLLALSCILIPILRGVHALPESASPVYAAENPAGLPAQANPPVQTDPPAQASPPVQTEGGMDETYCALLLLAGAVLAVLLTVLVFSVRTRRLLQKKLREHEHAFHSLVKRLEDSVAERTDKLRRENLRQSRLLAELERDAEAGRSVQFGLLPKSPRSFAPYRFQHMLYPSRYFSGDFLDWFEIDEGHIGFYLADVSGHGLSSSFLTVLLKSLIDKTLEGYTSGNDRLILNPAGVLLHVNGEILRQRFDKHLTLVYGVIDTKANTLLYTSGGQFPFPVLVSGENDIRSIGEDAYPLGLFAFADYQNQSCALPERFSLIIASDGLLELMDGENLIERENNFAELCREGEISDRTLRKRLDLRVGEALTDDVTLLIITKE